MNKIAEKIKSLIVSKSCFLLFDFNLSQFFRLEAFDTVVYLFNYIQFTSLAHNISLKNFFKAYYNNYQDVYTQNLSYLPIWGCKLSVYIP